MKLTKLAATCFMGGTFTVELGALNIVTGKNDAGKTRLGNLIKLLLLGYLPTLDKTAQGIFKLSSGPVMNLSGEFDNGAIIKRSWGQSGYGNVKTTKSVPAEFDEKTPLVLLDADDYFGRTARGRVEMVFSVASQIDIEPGAIVGKLRELLGEETERKMHIPWTGSAIFGGPQVWLEMWLGDIEKARSSAAADVRRYTQTLQGLSTLQLADKPATRSVEEIDAEIEKEQHEAALKKAVKHSLEITQSKNEEVELERASLQHRIEQAGDPPQRDFDIVTLREREGQLGRSVSLIEIREREHEEWARLDTAQRSKIDQLVNEIAELKKNDGTNEKATRQLIGKIEAAIARGTKKCSKCKQVIPAKIKGASDLPNLRLKLQDQEHRAFLVGVKQREITQLNEAAQSEPEHSSDNKEVLQAELSQVQADIDEYIATADVQAWRKQLAEMPPTVYHSAEIATLTAEAQTHVDRAETLRTERKAAESDRQDRKRLAEAKEAQEAAITAEARYKEAKAFLLQKKAELITQVFGPLLETAAMFMRGIFPQKVEYRDGELGMFVGDSWVTEASFGGAKRALLHAALQCALGAQSPARIIIMDELATIDVENTRQFLSNVWDAYGAKRFDQFICMTARYDGPRSGFTTLTAKDNTYVTT